MITAALKLVPDVIKIPASMILGAGIAFYPVKWYGASQEKQRAEVAALTRSIEVIRDRQAANADIAIAPATDVCRSLRLSEQDYRECVRRVGTDDPVAEHLGDDHQNRPAVCQPGREP